MEQTVEIGIPLRYARETPRGWLWHVDMDPGNPEVGPQPNVVRYVVARGRVSATRRVMETLYATVALSFAHDHGFPEAYGDEEEDDEFWDEQADWECQKSFY